MDLRARIWNKLKQVTYEWEWAKNFCEALKEGWRSLFSRDKGGVRYGTGGWVDGRSQMSGSGVPDRSVKGGKVRGGGRDVHWVGIEVLCVGHSYILSLKHCLKGEMGEMRICHVHIGRFLWDRRLRRFRGEGCGGGGSGWFRGRGEGTLGSQRHSIIGGFLGE